LRERFPNVRIYSMYGLTECKRVSYLPPEQLDARPTSVGRGMPNEEVFIVDDQGRRLKTGIGELVVRGSNVMKGYWEMPEETARMLKAGALPGESLLYSGDLFQMDEEGYLYFVARKDDIIKTRGEKVAPREVEETIARLAGVAEVAVYGVPDDALGEAVVAAITLDTSACLSIDDVRRHCRRHLLDFMVPKFVDIRESLPVTTNGKVSRRQLRGSVATSKGV
jgi:acyl-CoA synthetase (AMP-forming)/AMP-acid ligase II